MVSPEISVVANDGVIAAIVDVDMNLGILKERAHHGILRNQLKITRVDLDDVERFDLRMIGHDLSPGAGGQADHEDALGSDMDGAQNQSADDQIRVMTRIDPEIAVVHATAKNCRLLGHRNYAVPIFDHAGKRGAGLRAVSES